MATWEQIRADFARAIDHVWGAGTSSKLSVDINNATNAKGTLAALICDPRERFAIGDTLVRHASHYTLRVSPELLKEPDDVVWQVLVHEAIHVGYGNHDARFERVAREKGTYSSELGMRTGGLYVVKYKPTGAPKSGRYKVVLETKDKDEAMSFAYGRKAGPGAYVVLH